jgi:hypothetical protein
VEAVTARPRVELCDDTVECGVSRVEVAQIRPQRVGRAVERARRLMPRAQLGDDASAFIAGEGRFDEIAGVVEIDATVDSAQFSADPYFFSGTNVTCTRLSPLRYVRAAC